MLSATKVPFSVRHLLLVRKPGEKDKSLGMRIAASIPVALYPLVFLVMLLARVDPEGGMVIALAFWLFIGIWEWLYLAPAIGWALLKRRMEIAKGLALGGFLIAIANVGAWGIGYFLGVRQWAQ